MTAITTDEAVKLINTSVPKNLYDEYVMKRDIAFVVSAENIISGNAYY